MINTVFGNKKGDFFNKKSIKVLAGIFVLGLLISSLIAPLTNPKDFKLERIKIYNPGIERLQTEYYLGKVNITLLSIGFISSVPSSIAIDYGRYGFIFNESREGNKFSLTSVSNKTNQTKFISHVSDIKNSQFKLPGILGFDLRDESIAIKFDRETFKQNKIDYFTIEGLIPTNISLDKFNYEDNFDHSDVCYGNGCRIEIKINNSLDIPVDLERDTVWNLNNRNVSNVSLCTFDKIAAEYQFDNDIVKYEEQRCGSTNSCEFEIRGKKLDGTFYSPFRVNFYNNGPGVIARNDINIEIPVDIKMSFYIKC